MSVLNCEKLIKIYDNNDATNKVVAVDNVNIKINEGDFIAIMGPSGSGKTTLLNLLSGIDKLTKGVIKINNEDISLLNDDNLALFRRRNLGYVFQDYNLLDSLTISENIMLPMILDKKDIKEMKIKTRELLYLLDIKNIENKYPNNTSGGQQQRASIARALINEPSIIFADEPTGNLDSNSSCSVMECFTKINNEKNATILMVTHDSFAASFCKKIIFIKDGSVIKELIRESSREDFLKEIINSLGNLRGESNEL